MIRHKGGEKARAEMMIRDLDLKGDNFNIADVIITYKDSLESVRYYVSIGEFSSIVLEDPILRDRIDYCYRTREDFLKDFDKNNGEDFFIYKLESLELWSFIKP